MKKNKKLSSTDGSDNTLINDEIRYHAIFEATGTATLIVEEDTTISMANKKCFQLTGYLPDELIGQKWIRFVVPEYLELMRKNHELRRSEPDKVPKNYEVKLINKHGEIRDVILDVNMISDSKQSVVSLQDITDLKKAENALKLSENKYRIVIENSTNLFYTHNVENVLTFVSPQSTTFLDCEPEEAMVNWQNFVTENPLNQKGIKNTAIAIETGKPQPPYQLELITRKGRILWVEVNESPVVVDGKTTAITGSLTDITQKKKLEFLLNETEKDLKLFRSLIENVIDSFHVVDPETGQILDINETGCIELGYSREELLLMSIPDINTEIDMTLFRKAVKELKKTGSMLLESTHKCKDGSIFPVELNIKYIVLDKPYIVTVARNITERKRSEMLLKETDKNYKDIFYFAPVGIYQSSKEGTIIDCNHKFAEMLGYEKSEKLLGLSMSKDIYWDSGEREKLISMYENTGVVHNLELRWKKKDGALIWILLSSHIKKDKNKNTVSFEGFIRDITKQKMTEGKLFLQSTALESAANGIVITDLNGKIEWANSAFMNLTGYSIDEVNGKQLNILKSGYQDELFYKNLWDTILSGKVWHGELINMRKDGSLYNEEMTITPVRDRDYNINNYIAIKQNVTERKITQNELILAKEKAERSNKLKDAFIANISHEIRTPLNGILGMTGLIKNSLSNYVKEEESDFFNAIEYSSSRIVRTIDMILNFSRLQVGEFTVSKKQIKLAILIDNLMKEYQSKADGKSLKLLFVNKLKNVYIEADEYCIAQAISNLMDNAIKYTNIGTVILTLYKNSDNNILLDVKDTGIGIAKNYLQDIFEPYTQEETGYSRSYEGVGLGMSLVKKYLYLNGADISVESQKEKGTRFTIHFQRSISKKSAKLSGNIDAKVLNKIVPKKQTDGNYLYKILVVEDDAINQLYIKSLLKKDYTTDTAFSAEQALKKMKTTSFDMILMDVSLKGNMNGLELTKLLRKKDRYIDIPIIAVTGHSSEEDRQNCLRAGFSEFLPKPFSKEELFKRILMFTSKEKKKTKKS